MSYLLLFILFLIGIYIYYIYCLPCESFTINYKGIYLNPTESIEYLNNLPEFNYYLENTPKNQYNYISKGELNKNNSLDDYRKYYLRQFKPWTISEIQKINTAIKELYKECDYYNNIWNTPWKFIKFSDDLEGGMPFTFGETIMMPENLLKRDLDNELLETLLHEKIHVLQKQNRDYWFQHIRQKLPWIQPLEPLPNGFRERYLFNPDGVELGWKYIINGKKYIPYLKFQNREVKPDIFNRPLDSEFMDAMPVNNSWYHPMELTATALSKYPFDDMNKKLNKYYIFFKDLV
jgi:hypothetical protein